MKINLNETCDICKNEILEVIDTDEWFVPSCFNNECCFYVDCHIIKRNKENIENRNQNKMD